MVKWNAIALAAPGSLLTAGLGVALVLAAFGRHPMWPYEPVNLSEAAAVRDEAEIVRLVERGEDPDAARNVRAGLLLDVAVRVTPLEAAVASKDPQIVRVVLANGAAVDASLWNRLRCLTESQEMMALLDQLRPAGVVMRCDDVSAQ
ncbi:MAG: hypothetical protein EXQ53_04865 [Acidobacteria bacterium]|nr:hypothetical protein [Acidobacteriota bacterium]